MTVGRPLTPLVELKNVYRDFIINDEGSGKPSKDKVLKLTALSKVDLKLNSGEFVFLTGPSGAGKTTLLKIILGIANPSSGDVFTLGNHINSLSESKRRAVRKQIGIIFQDHRLLAPLNVYENVELPLKFMGHTKKERDFRVKEILETVEMRSHIYANVETLSAGEKQRIGIARALVHTPKLIIADEPTGNLDPVTARSLVSMLRDLKGQGTTVFIASHDMSLVRDFGARVLEIVSGKFQGDSVSGVRQKAYKVPGFWQENVL